VAGRPIAAVIAVQNFRKLRRLTPCASNSFERDISKDSVDVNSFPIHLPFPAIVYAYDIFIRMMAINQNESDHEKNTNENVAYNTQRKFMIEFVLNNSFFSVIAKRI